MNTRIRPIVTMMLASSLLIIGLQLYWNFQTFQNYTHIFQSESSAALGRVVQHLSDRKRDQLAASYRSWMADTANISITAKKRTTGEGYIFSIQDKKAPAIPRPPFRINSGNLEALDTSGMWKKKFIDSFVKNMLYNDLKSNRINFYTDFLGLSLIEAYQRDTIDLALLRKFYRRELQNEGFDQPFSFVKLPYTFKSFVADSARTPGLYRTSAFKYGFGSPVSISASFENPNLTVLKKMRWAILSSLSLTLIIVYCFAYTIRSMLSQKKLTELKDNFVNNMTHELQTPVTTISVAAEAVQDFSVDSSTAKDYMAIIRDQARNLTMLIDQILNSDRNGIKGLDLKKEHFNFSKLLEDRISHYRPLFEASYAITTITIQPDLFFSGDKVHLGNVVSNLLDNAIKYAHLPPKIDITLAEERNSIVLQITNDGQGIPILYHKKIFERFFRVPTGNIHNIKGYGLGLSYAKDIVQRHNGSLTFESNAVATTFILTLPLNTNEYTKHTVS